MFEGRDLVTAPEAELQRIRGGDIAMVFQDPMKPLDPVYRIGDQIVEQIRAHDSTSRSRPLSIAPSS